MAVMAAYCLYITEKGEEVRKAALTERLHLCLASHVRPSHFHHRESSFGARSFSIVARALHSEGATRLSLGTSNAPRPFPVQGVQESPRLHNVEWSFDRPFAWLSQNRRTWSSFSGYIVASFERTKAETLEHISIALKRRRDFRFTHLLPCPDKSIDLPSTPSLLQSSRSKHVWTPVPPICDERRPPTLHAR